MFFQQHKLNLRIGLTINLPEKWTRFHYKNTSKRDLKEIHLTQIHRMFFLMRILELQKETIKTINYETCWRYKYARFINWSHRPNTRWFLMLIIKLSKTCTKLVKIQFLLHVLQNQKINIFHPKPEWEFFFNTAIIKTTQIKINKQAMN